ncbi:BPSL0761 family protein [Variovorax sp. GT1P44]|uniref:BPSL0761 family protein n=1 Tax=Variovorax sp. GT1P44 TaxID=3443742 RepID=UPI003F445A11
MTLPQERMKAFLRVGEVLRDIAKTDQHIQTWGAELPQRLVHEAQLTLRDYPSSLELEWAADGQRSMHTWMVREKVRGIDQQDDVFACLQEAAGRVAADTASDNLPFDGDTFLQSWLANEHPALAYRAPAELLDKTSDPEMFVCLFVAEYAVTREARRVFRSVSEAYCWLRIGHRSLGAIPLEILGTDGGQQRVIAELRRIASGGSAR